MFYHIQSPPVLRNRSRSRKRRFDNEGRRLTSSMVHNRALFPDDFEEEGMARGRSYYDKNTLANSGIVLFVILFLISCTLRYFMEMFTNLFLSSFREQINWEKQFKDSCGNDNTNKFLCKAIQLCMQEVIPEILPVSPDDVWIQILLVIIILLMKDRYEESQRKR